MSAQDPDRILSGLIRIHSVLGKGHAPLRAFQDKKELLVHVCREIAALQGIELVFPDFLANDSTDTIMNLISMQSGVRIRKVRLQENWWTSDSGFLLGFYREIPCTLSPLKSGGYRLSSPVYGDLDIRAPCKELDGFAWTFTTPLPNRKLSGMDIVRFAIIPVKKALVSTAWIQAILICLTMLLPITMGYLFDHINILPGTGIITQLGIALLVNAIVYSILSLNQTFMLLHIRFKVQAGLEPAIWDRILKLPTGFFRQFKAGEIAYRAGAIASIQELLTQSAIISIFSFIMSGLALMLMFYYDPHLALLALGGFLVSALVLYLLNRKLLIYERQIYTFLSRQAGIVFQSITGIIKFKVSATEFRAFNQWAEYFSELLTAKFRAGSVRIFVRILNETLLIIMTLLLFVTYYFQSHRIGVGDFVAFNAAFTQFFTAMLGLSFFVSSLIEIIPLFEKSLVIFQSDIEPVETVSRKIDLRGGITLRNISFRYDESQPLILKNINLEVTPGESLGITGGSGCGKSTLFRILLGIEKPSSGKVYYDGLDMDLLNLGMLRQQIGVVSQKSTLIPGTILENIIGNDPELTRKDAWDIVYTLGLEQMFKAFPMEMDTFINEGMQSLSGGEMQRIILARALIKKPKILFLDEATSSLDSKNQAKVQDYLRTQKVTQLIIAHRLSTLKHTDRIIVLQGGDIVQSGPFSELISTPGYFADLAHLQFMRVE